MKHLSLTAGLLSTFAAVAIAPAIALAQPQRVTLDEMRAALQRGDQVAFVQADGQSLKGKLTRIDESVLQVMVTTMDDKGVVKERDVVVPFSDLQSLERRKDSVMNGVRNGALVGAGIAAAFFIHSVAIDANEMDEWGASHVDGIRPCYTGIGALVGWSIDAANSKPPLVWSGTAGGLKLELKPSLSLTRLRPYSPPSHGVSLRMVISF